MKQLFTAKNAQYAAFAFALLAMSGSLFFSEGLHYTPCILCWYQRIAMYPLVAILLVGILRKDTRLYQFVLPLAIIGWGIAGYHSFLQWGVIPEHLSPCINTATSCVTRPVNLLGFITIPFLSWVAFTSVISAMLVEWRTTK